MKFWRKSSTPSYVTMWRHVARSATQPLRQVPRRLLLGGQELQGAEMLELGTNHMVGKCKCLPNGRFRYLRYSLLWYLFNLIYTLCQRVVSGASLWGHWFLFWGESCITTVDYLTMPFGALGTPLVNARSWHCFIFGKYWGRSILSCHPLAKNCVCRIIYVR